MCIQTITNHHPCVHSGRSFALSSPSSETCTKRRLILITSHFYFWRPIYEFTVFSQFSSPPVSPVLRPPPPQISSLLFSTYRCVSRTSHDSCCMWQKEQWLCPLSRCASVTLSANFILSWFISMIRDGIYFFSLKCHPLIPCETLSLGDFLGGGVSWPVLVHGTPVEWFIARRLHCFLSCQLSDVNAGD